MFSRRVIAIGLRALLVAAAVSTGGEERQPVAEATPETLTIRLEDTPPPQDPPPAEETPTPEPSPTPTEIPQ